VRKGGVAVECDLPDHPGWARGGEVRLGQVLLNLITNAADAMAESDPRVLTIEVRDHDGLSVRFQDTGPGIDDPDRVFDPFYTPKSVGAAEGMGLGLSISYGIVQSFGGEIRGRNTEAGALFTVELEQWRDAEQAA